jgi:hypothetical protein
VLALPSCILQPLWDQFAALLPQRHDPHPLGCHRRRIPDRVIFDKLIQVLVFGCGYRRIEDTTCSATTLRRRRDEWIALGLGERLHLLVLSAYDRMLALALDTLAVDGCITKGALRRPDRRPQPGGPRQTGPETLAGHRGQGHPAGCGASTRQPPRLPGCWLRPWTGHLAPWPSWGRCPPRSRWPWTPATTATPPAPPWPSATWPARSPARASPPPIQATSGWPVERTFAWGNQFGKLRWCTERTTPVVEFWIALAHAIVTLGRLLRQAWTCYRWQGRPRRRP